MKKGRTKPKQLYLVKGRSIDGTVYADAVGSSFLSWVPAAEDASKLTTEEAIKIIKEQRRKNRTADADSTIGCLCMIPLEEA